MKPNVNLINASAGTGKTFAVTQNILKEILSSSDSDHFKKILALTFTNKAANEMKDFISEDLIEDNDIKDPSSLKAKELFEAIKNMRYASDLVDDPFAKRFKGKVLEALLESPEQMVKFVHYALREDKEPLPKEVYAIKDMQEDDITYGLEGLDLEPDDIALYIIEHYGDGKDSKRTEKAVKAAMEMLDLLMLSRYDEKDLDDLKDIEGIETQKETKALVVQKITSIPYLRA